MKFTFTFEGDDSVEEIVKVLQRGTPNDIDPYTRTKLIDFFGINTVADLNMLDALLFKSTLDPREEVTDDILCADTATDFEEPTTTATIIDHSDELPPSLEVDSAGELWDAAKHSSSKAITADGRWRVRRGLQKADEVEDVVVSDPVPQPPAPTELNAAAVMIKVSQLVKDGTLNQAEIDAALQAVGLVKLVDLVKNKDVLEQFTTLLGV